MTRKRLAASWLGQKPVSLCLDPWVFFFSNLSSLFKSRSLYSRSPLRLTYQFPSAEIYSWSLEPGADGTEISTDGWIFGKSIMKLLNFPNVSHSITAMNGGEERMKNKAKQHERVGVTCRPRAESNDNNTSFKLVPKMSGKQLGQYWSGLKGGVVSKDLKATLKEP